jgi:hypothetical protein
MRSVIVYFIVFCFGLVLGQKDCGFQPLQVYKSANITIWPECTLFKPDSSPVMHDLVNVVIQLRGIVSQRFGESGVRGLILACDTSGLSEQMLRKFGTPQFLETSLNGLTRYIATTYGSNVKLGKLALGSFSAGYAPMQKHILHPRVDSVVILDGIHYGPPKQPNPMEHKPFVDFAKLAVVKNGKMFMITHSEITPPYSSSTDAANYIMGQVGVTRGSGSPDPLYRYKTRYGTVIQPKTRGSLEGFHVEGYPGQTAQSHVEQIDHLGNLWNKYLAQRWNCE